MSDSKVEQKKRPNPDLDTEDAENNKEKDNKISNNNNENKKAKVGEKEGEKENKKVEEKEKEEKENENEIKSVSDLWPDVVHMVGVVDDMDTDENYESEEENEGEKEEGDEEDEEFGGIPGDEIEGMVFYGFNREEIEKLLAIQKQYGKDNEEIFGETARTNEESGWFSLRDLCVRFALKKPKKMKPIAQEMFDNHPSDFTFFSFTLSKEKPPGDNVLKVSPSEYDPQLCTAFCAPEKWCWVSDFKTVDNDLQQTYHKLVYKNLLL